MIPPGGTGRTTVHCSARRRAAPPPPPGRSGENPPRSVDTPPPPRVAHTTPPKAGGCAILEGVPPGYVTIDTVPYSEIYYEDKKLGDTPLSRQKLPAGCVELVAKSKDPPKEKRVRIQVEPNSTRRFRFEL
jgi:hypothetical protein